MSVFSNSLFCAPELGLLKFYLKQAVEKSSLKCLKDIEKSESEKLVVEFLVPAVQQSIKDCSNVGNWRDEKDFVLVKIHGWLFMSWLTTRFDMTGDMFLPINTVFYLQVLRICQFEKYLIQCLSNVNEATMEILIEDIASKACEDKANLIVRLVEQCLLQLGSCEENFGKILDTKLCHIITQVAKNVELQWIQVDILSKLSEKLNTLLAELKKAPSNNLGSIFTENMNIIKFNERLSYFISNVEGKKMAMKSVSNNPTAELDEERVKNGSQGCVKAVLCLVFCINHVITIEWKSLFTWHLTDHGNEVIQGVKDTNCHSLLFRLFTTCQSLQSWVVDKTSCNELQVLGDVLEPYLQQYATSEEMVCIKDISSGQNVENKSTDIVDEIGMINGTLEEQLQHVLYQIDENLLGDEACFEWLLLKEELYIDVRWLKSVETHAKKFVSIKIMKMLLDVLSVFQEFDIMPGGVHANIYNSLKKVIVDLLRHLTLPEQKEIVLYNFDLTCLHSNSYKHSFFVHPDDETSESLLEDILTASMNKLVNRSSKGFSKDVMDGIIQACLLSPYLALKKLWTEASKHGGYEKVICKLLQMIPWLVSLCREDDDSLIIQVVKHEVMSSHGFSKKQEGQFLKLIEALMQPYVHPLFGTKEPALVAASDISKNVVIPLLTDEDDAISPSILLHVLLKCLSCGLISTDQQAHYMVDQEHVLQLLFVVLEIYEEIEQFWVDWVASESLDGKLDSTDFDDVTVIDVWNQMDITFKIIEEYLVPFLTEDISHEPDRYYDYIPTMQDHLNKLDWFASLVIIPLLQRDVFKECAIKSPSSLTNLMSSHFNVQSMQEIESTTSFWTIYFKSCAHSNEVFGMFLSKLQESHPRDTEASYNDTDEIIHDLANLLPFTTRKQWQRILNLSVEMMKYGYLILTDEWKADLMVLPDNLDGNIIIKNSELLVLILRAISNMHWRTLDVWIATIKNYISNMKELSLEIGNEDKFEVTCHLLAHLAYIAFKIVPGDFQEHITIILLDIFNQCLSCVSAEDVSYLQGIINMVSHSELRLAMTNTMGKMLSKERK